MAMYSDEQRFVWDIDALQEIVKYPDARHLVEASAILRRLLTDSAGPLMHKVAAGRDFKPRFKVAPSGREELDSILGDKLLFHWSNPDPTWGGGIQFREMSLDAFLAEPMVFAASKKISVKHLINYMANVGGGVHQGKPTKRDNAEEIHATGSNVELEGFPYPVASIAPITKIVVEALMPLYLRLRA